MSQLTMSNKAYNTALIQNPEWWRKAVIYQIYPRSFQDTNNDGIGDLKGITQRLPYLADLGVNTIWISPFFRSPMADFGYDVADYCDVDPIFGTLDDFEELLSSAHNLNLRVVIDFVPNHTSDHHPWFIESRSSRDNPKHDWYIWHDPQPDGSPPNNIKGFFGDSIWAFDETRNQYYLHMFLKEQPDLNWRNPDVVEAMHNVMHFWLEKGVDGFRLDAVTVLSKAEQLDDLSEEALNSEGFDLIKHLTQIHNHSDIRGYMRGMRRVVDGYNHDPVLIGETSATDFDDLISFYGMNLDEIHLPMNLNTLQLTWNASEIRQSITAYYDAITENMMPSIVLGNHDIHRLANRYGEANHRSANMLLLTLWGVPTMYYGDELGMLNGKIEPEERQDPWAQDGAGRDPERTPMQWDNTPNAGFTDVTVTPWLPINSTFTSNVATQADNPTSSLNFCKELLELRNTLSALHSGSIQFLDTNNSDLLAYIRQSDAEKLLIVINFSKNTHQIDISTLTTKTDLVLSSQMQKRNLTSLQEIDIAPYESIILRLNVD